MQPTWKKLLAPLASLKLTVILIAMAMLLIYAGTWAQIDNGIWTVQRKYFHSLLTWIDFQTFLPRPKLGEAGIPGGFPMLGGYAIGLLLLINLVAAHLVRFKLTWKRTGIILIHLGLILLLVGEGITSRHATEAQMSIEEGQTVSFTQDTREVELALIDPSSPDHDHVVIVPASQLKTGATITDAQLPVSIHVDQFFPNSIILGPMQAAGRVQARATAGESKMLAVLGEPPSGGIEGAIDLPSAYVALSNGDQAIGTYLVSSVLEPATRQPIVGAQTVDAAGKQWLIQLRFKREYKPYSLTLKQFRFDRYTGTNTAKNFSSLVRLVDPQTGTDREIKVWMNHPMRYRGATFYQADWNKRTEHGTVLQVVSNPAWTMPYVACVIGGLGLLIHFGITLITFLRKQAKIRSEAPPATNMPRPVRRRREAEATPAAVPWISAGILVPVIITGVCAFDVLGHMRGPAQETPYDLAAFGQLPVSHEGRIQPLDSLARNSLKVLFSRESFSVNGTKTPALQWLIDLWANPEVAAKYEVFRVDFPDLLNFLELEPKPAGTFEQITGIVGVTPYRFSWNELTPKFAKLQQELDKLRDRDEKTYTLFERRLVDLYEKLQTYQQLAALETLHTVPPTRAGEDWKTPAEVSGDAKDFAALPPDVQGFLRIIGDYNQKSFGDFDRDTAAYASSLENRSPALPTSAVRFEAFFNRFDPFTNALICYLIAFLLLALSWLRWQVPLRRAAWSVLVLAFIVHTFGMTARIYISGRPPVTNLASSALFIAWGAVFLAAAIEVVYRDGIGILAASLVGFLSLLIGDRLAVTGDTMKVLQAVLDTNFWLATHVIIINLGYAATFLAGILGIVYVVRGFFTPSLDREAGKDLIRMVYGVTCFAMTFSFIGTVLGGIWADQSWGRFWGWDPKENGAVLIVLANALLLHARWGGLVRDRGIACLAIFGNIVTSWSWFGTNMLGIGLHSYGFMERALNWLLAFVVTQIALIIIANVPITWWRSYPRLISTTPAPAVPQSVPSPA